MRQTRFTRTLIIWLVGAALAAALPAAALASQGGARHNPRSTVALSRSLFVFGREGGNIRPYSYTISANGQVMGGLSGAHIQLSSDTLSGLVKLARAEGFFALPNTIVGHGLPDIAGHFITINTATGAKTVHEHLAHNASFDQLYAVLSAVVGQYQ